MCDNCNNQINPSGYGELPMVCPYCNEYIGDQLPSKKKVVEKCIICHTNLYEDDKCYYLNGQYFCEDCVNSSNFKLDNEKEIEEWEK